MGNSRKQAFPPPVAVPPQPEPPPKIPLGEALVRVRNAYAALHGDFQYLIVAATELQAALTQKDQTIKALQAELAEKNLALQQYAEKAQSPA